MYSEYEMELRKKQISRQRFLIDTLKTVNKQIKVENKRLKELVDLLENLLACYRTGGRPTNKVLDGISKLKKNLKGK